MKSLLAGAFLFLLQMQMGYSQSAAGHDFSMTLDQFEQQALKPKQEVWVVDFWASWCGPCIQSIPHLKQLHQQYAQQNVRFISISWDEAEVKWKQALDRFQMPWQHLRVTRAQAAFMDAHFPHRTIPTAFVIRADGKVKRANGVDLLEPAIEKALKAQR